MSLTYFLKHPTVKALFNDEFPLPKQVIHGEIAAEPITKNYPLVGTAFDYLLRFYLERSNPNCIARPWIAEDPYWSPNDSDFDLLTKEMKSFLKNARKFHTEYLDGGSIDDDLIEMSLVLAQIDVLQRTGNIFPDFGKVKNEDIRDLRNLISLTNLEMFRAEKTCYLNPTFGYGSRLVRGADADLIVDDILIDIKTTKKLSFTKDYYHQLIGYYILSKLGEINGTDHVKISSIAVYFSRHGILHQIPTSEIENSPGFSEFVKTFEKLAIKMFGARSF